MRVQQEPPPPDCQLLNLRMRETLNSGDTTPRRMIGVTLHSHVRYNQTTQPERGRAEEGARLLRTGSWTGPPRGKRAPRVGISSTVFGVRSCLLRNQLRNSAGSEWASLRYLRLLSTEIACDPPPEPQP